MKYPVTPFTRERVLAVGGELVLDQHAAAGAERQAFDVVVLRRVRRDVEDRLASGRSTSPIASRLILPAADRYASISAGDIVSAPAMLSKPRVESSGGRNFVASTSSASRSRIALRVLGAIEPVESRRREMRDAPWRRARPPSSERSDVHGGRRPDDASSVGGIRPARTLRTTFSANSGWSARREKSSWSLSSTSPPVFRRALWHVTQY